ncbi:MAG: GNAT family N-acetyltransferase [Alphaproteobacteria bacterium]|nr:GNAT family N-acetyltransferase [Alphaproteobacteria bacterium]
MSEPIISRRLRLEAATAAMIALELTIRPALFAYLRVAEPEDWPPPLNDDETFRYFEDSLRADPGLTGWAFWYVILRHEGGDALVGTAGFKGKPDADGLVDVGYAIRPHYHRMGIASETVGLLLSWATARGARYVIAETFADHVASIGVMRKNGLAFIGAGAEPNVVRYGRSLVA